MPKDENIKEIAKRWRENWKADSEKSDYETPFSELELEFMKLAINKLQKFTDSDEPREAHKPILQRNIDIIKKHITSTDTVQPEPRFAGRYFWDDLRRELPPKDREFPLTLTLSRIFRGDSRIFSEEEFLEMVKEYKLEVCQ